MSETTSSAPLTDVEKVSARHHLGVSVVGTGPTFDPFGRTYAQSPRLEFILSNLASPELDMVRQWLTDLDVAEAALRSAQQNLDTASAAVWKHNPDEVADRAGHLGMMRRQFAADLGVSYTAATQSRSAHLIV